MQNNEEDLVRRVQQNDQLAFTELYEAYFDKIYRYIVLKTGDRIEAEDMTQQVFLKALKSIHSFKWRGKPFSAWLYRIAHNQVVDHLRKRSTRQIAMLDEELPLISDNPYDDPQNLTEQSFSIEQLMAATQKLTEAQREVISLRFTSDLPIAQVAKIMGKSVGAVKTLQHAAITTLRKILVIETSE